MDSAQLRLFARRNPLGQKLGSHFFRSIPALPGVYWMLDGKGRVLDVGRCDNLKLHMNELQRLNVDSLGPRLESLVLGAERIGFQVTRSRESAAVVESELLKRLKPLSKMASCRTSDRASGAIAKPLLWVVRSMPRSWRLEVSTSDREAAIDQTGRPLVEGLFEIGPFPNGPRALKIQAALLRQLYGFTRGVFSLLDVPPVFMRDATAHASVILDRDLSDDLAGPSAEEKREFNSALMEATVRFLRGLDDWPDFQPPFGDRWAQTLWASDQIKLKLAARGILRSPAQNAIV